MARTGHPLTRTYTDRQWREDLNFMAARMKDIHPNLFHAIPEERFEVEVRKLETEIPHLSDPQVLVGLLKLAALTRDWHTQIISRNLTERWFPLRMEKLQDGVFITAVSHKYAHTLGARVLWIGNETTDCAFEKIEQITAHDNVHSQRYFAAMLACMPPVLNGLDIAEETSPLGLEIQPVNGDRSWIEIEAEAFESDDDFSWFWRKETAPAEVCFTVTTDRLALPAYWRNLACNYWFEHLAAYRAIYVGFNLTIDDAAESFKEFNRRLWETVDQRKIEGLVIDLRHNLGGDNTILPPLYAGVLKRSRINREGGLFVLTGPKNVSASAHCGAWFEQNTRAILVGEPTGARPNQYADPQSVRLPHSQLRLMVANRYWQNGPAGDARQWIEPQVAAGFRASEYFGLKDPAMEQVLKFWG